MEVCLSIARDLRSSFTECPAEIGPKVHRDSRTENGGSGTSVVRRDLVSVIQKPTVCVPVFVPFFVPFGVREVG